MKKTAGEASSGFISKSVLFDYSDKQVKQAMTCDSGPAECSSEKGGLEKGLLRKVVERSVLARKYKQFL